MLRAQAVSCAQETQDSASSHASAHDPASQQRNAYRERMAENPIYAYLRSILDKFHIDNGSVVD